MSTVAYPLLRELAEGIEDIFDSAVCSGIVGDLAHRRRGGFHISREDQPSSNYSVTRPDDKAGNGPDDAAAAVDITMNPADMRTATLRLRKIWDNLKDPRRKFLNAFNGWLGTGDAIRFDVYARLKKKATRDHTWHLHAEIRRKWVKIKLMVKAILSALRGESVTAYLASIGKPEVAAVAASDNASPARLKAPAYPGRVLRRNDRATKPDPAVRTFQQRMRDRGWTSIGPADGFPGAKFERVVKRWQQLRKLTPDGEVGPKTWPTPWTHPMAAAKA